MSGLCQGETTLTSSAAAVGIATVRGAVLYSSTRPAPLTAKKIINFKELKNSFDFLHCDRGRKRILSVWIFTFRWKPPNIHCWILSAFDCFVIRIDLHGRVWSRRNWHGRVRVWSRRWNDGLGSCCWFGRLGRLLRLCGICGLCFRDVERCLKMRGFEIVSLYLPPKKHVKEFVKMCFSF